MIDIHCHLLPGIDDGPDTLDQSLALARLACENGITHSVLTPHIHPGRYENSAAVIAQACKTFQRELIRESIPLQLGYAAGVRLTDQIMQLLVREKIPYVFGICGHGNVGLLDALYDVRDEVKVISPRHEQTAAHMADA